jgi:hypothetical protein
LKLAAAQKFLLKSSRALARGVLLTPEFCLLTSSLAPLLGGRVMVQTP